MVPDSAGANLWPSAAVRDTESFVPVQVAHICTDNSVRCQPHRSVHVRSVQVDLTSVGMHNFTDILDVLFE